ncbi:MAG: hypothetical protein IT166_16885 [Bryobacterales bacterium]|nr:hypothetical protein [Bryobacterales bacterium]
MNANPIQSLLARWPQGEPAHVELLRDAGVEFVVEDSPPPAFAEALRKAGIGVLSNSALGPVMKDGLWPGISRGPNVEGRGDETASASREPWVNANGYQVQVERALGGKPLLGYLPNDRAGVSPDRVVPFDTLKLALTEARVNGGNYILALEPHYRTALLGGEEKAKSAWRSLGTTARWLKANASSYGLPLLPTITMVVDRSDETHEMANLLFRRGASPNVVSVERVPKPSPRILVVSAAGLKPVPEAVLDHARAGATVIIDAAPAAAWKKVKTERDRDFYSLGKGQVLVYHEPIADPSEYALDVIDVATYRRRPVRIWNALASIAIAGSGPVRGQTLMHVVNYGSAIDQEVQARVQGHFTKATLLRPESQPLDLKVFHRGTTTEIFLPSLDMVATVRFLV